VASSVVVVGGTAGLGRAIAEAYAERQADVLITGRDEARASGVAREIGRGTKGAGLDLARPAEIADRLGGLGRVDHLVLAAIDRDENSVRDFRVEAAIRLVTLKLVGYAEVVHCLAGRFGDDASILIFGGQAKARPYPGSTTVTTVNGGVTTLVNTLAVELAPVRVNALHPGIVGDSPTWRDKRPVLEGVKARTPTGRLVTVQDIVGAAVFLLENRGVNAVNLEVDGGWLLG